MASTSDMRVLDDIEVVCLSGLESKFCRRKLEHSMEETAVVVDNISSLASEGHGVLLVSTGFKGFTSILSELEELGRNPYLVEVASVTEAMLAGIDLDKVILYHVGLMQLTIAERRSARKVYPPVTRRQLLKNLFIVKPFYAIQPERVSEECASLCPYAAIQPEGGVDRSRCRGCMLCQALCGRQPSWSGAAALAYTYKFIEVNALDGVVFVCRRQLEALDEKAVEASPARMAIHPVPCISWLRPELLRALEKLDVYVIVFFDPNLCGSCPLKRAGEKAASILASSGINVGSSLTPASSYAFTGYSRPRRSPDFIVATLQAALGES